MHPNLSEGLDDLADLMADAARAGQPITIRLSPVQAAELAGAIHATSVDPGDMFAPESGGPAGFVLGSICASILIGGAIWALGALGVLSW